MPRSRHTRRARVTPARVGKLAAFTLAAVLGTLAFAVASLAACLGLLWMLAAVLNEFL